MSYKVIEAVRNSQYTQLLLYLKHNYNFKIKEMPEQHNILMLALQIPDENKRFKMFRFLLKLDIIDIHETDLNNHDIFFQAVLRSCEKELDLLMTYFHSEVDFARMDNCGKTILHYAVINNNMNILEILLNHCQKFKICTDIPDKITKLTPYLLACRLNHLEAANLLLKKGFASKNQADRIAFYNGEQWVQEGQVEKLKNYLKDKDEEMSIAKLNGNLRTYRELSNLSRTLDNEMYRDPSILPVLAKVISEHDKSHDFNKSNHYYKQPNMPQIKLIKSANSSNIQRQSNTTFQLASRVRTSTKRVQLNGSIFSTSSLSTNSQPSSINSQQTSSSNVNSSINNNSLTQQTQQSTPNVLANINSILKQKVKDFRRDSDNISKMNSLLEMTSNQSAVETFVGSKTETDTSMGGISMAGKTFDRLSSVELSNMFHAASLQKTANFRQTVKYMEPLFIPREMPSNKSKNKSGLSTLALIREESKKKGSKKVKKSTVKNSINVK